MERPHDQRVFNMRHVVILLGFVVPLVQGTALHCADYLQCEAEVMTLQRRCTDRSRNITSETCNLVDEFRELRSLMSMRETEFAICVGHESVREVGLNPDIKASECNVTVNEPSVIHGCWRSVAVVKRRCQRLKKCCPAADRCIKRLATSDTTNLVRRKHVDINLKTLKCRSEMEKVIKMNGNDKSNPIVNRAHAVITARSESLMDVVGQEHFMEDADEDPKSMDPFFPLKQKLRTKAKNVTTILKSRYTELARIAEELSAILLRKRQIRKQRELLKKYSSGFTSGKKRKLLLHSVKEAKGEAQKIRTLLKSVKNGSEILEVFKAASTIHPTMTTAKKKEFGKQIKFATVTSSNEVVETTLTATTPTTSTMSTELSTTLLPPPKIIRTADLTNVANKFGRPRKTFLPPPPDQDILLDRDTRTTVVPRAKSHHGKKRRHPLRVTQTRGLTSLPSMFGSSGASVPNLFAQKMKESRSVESPQKTPAEMQEYVRKGKGEVNRTTRAPEAYVGADGTWTMDPPNEEDSKKPFLEGQNEVIVTHEEGTFPMSPDHKELYGDGFENEIRRSGKHIWSKRKYSRVKLRKMVEAMATGEPLLITSVERSAKDHYGNHATMSHIVEKELLQTRKNGAQRIPFNLLDDSQQDRVGIFPITTKEPRRIKITMWPPGYRNHFTRRPIVLQATTPTSARVSVVGQPFTSRMPESFYKVFYPQLKPAKRHRLKGYRNKVLFARRHLKRQKGRVASNYANAVTHHQPDEHIPTAVTKLPIHRLRPKQLDNRVNQIIDDPGQGSPRIASASAISNLSKSPLVTPASSSNNETRNIEDLRFQLMLELELFIKSQHGKLRKEMESELQSERTSLLRRPLSEYSSSGPTIGYCELYAACSDELKSVEQRCKPTNSRLIPGLPKRRIGECNVELVPDFQKYDELKKESQNAFDECFVEELAIAQNKSKMKLTESFELDYEHEELCAEDWPLLPPYETLNTCHEQIRIIQNHCSKLGKCCGSVKKCQEYVSSMTITDLVSEMKSVLALKSAECQIKSFKKYNEKRLNEQRPLPRPALQHEDRITEEDLIFLLPDYEAGKRRPFSEYFIDDHPEVVTTRKTKKTTLL